jgi:hypothetical protein
MSAESPNIFNALFDLHPGEKHSQNENFLSEAFAHILRTVDGACEAWVNKLAKSQVRLAPGFEITTRSSEVGDEPGSIYYPDLKIKAQTETGKPVTVFAEHKWGSPCDPEQLRKYGRIAQKTSGEALLAFVGARTDQVEQARQVNTPVRCTCLFWEDLYDVLHNDVLRKLQRGDPMLEQFLNFMESNALSPGKPITLRQMQAHIEAYGLIDRLMRYGKKLKTDYSWEEIPVRYRTKNAPVIKDRAGRVAVEFWAPGWSPGIMAGFLHDVEECKVSFTAPDHGIDLMLRIQCDPNLNPKPETALAALSDKAQRLRVLGARVLLKDDPGNRNNYTLLIAQISLASVIEGKSTERVQVEAIHSKLSGWLDALFKDGKLEPALKTLKGELA